MIFVGRTTGIRCLRWTALFVLIARPASTQVRPDTDPSSGIRLGAVTMTPAVELSNAGFDTNILRELDDPKRDGVGTLTIDVGTYFRVHPVRFSTVNVVGLDYFKQYRSQRSVNRTHGVRADIPFARVTLYGAGEAVNARQRFNYEIEERVRRIVHAAKAGGELRLTPKTGLGLEIERTDIRFADEESIADVPLRHVFGRRVTRRSAFVRMAVTPLTSIVLRAEAERSRFETLTIRNADGVRVMPGLELKPGAIITGRIFVGYRWFNPSNNRFPAFSGVIAAADAFWTVGSVTRLGLRAERDVEYSYQTAEPVYVLMAGSGSVERRIGERWDLSGRVGLQTLDYRALTSFDMPDRSSGSRRPADTPPDHAMAPRRLDHGWRYTAGAGYQASRQLRIGADVEYVRRRSKLHDRQFDALRAMGTIRYDLAR